MKIRTISVNQAQTKAGGIKEIVIAGLLMVMMGLSTAITAQGIEEVVVTAQRREQNLQDVPISINAFSAEAIDKFMFGDVGDYIIRTPNASFSTDGSKSRRRISIRGVTDFLAINNTLKTATFGFYVDDFSVAGSTANPPILDIERIEILRGPQATYFGKNALGGGISVTSNKPDSSALGGEIMFDYSRFDTKDIEAMVNVPVIKDKLALRANIKYNESDGNIKNINPIGGGNDSEYQYAKVAARWTPMDNLTVDVTASIMDEVVGMREGVPTGVFSTFGSFLFANLPDTNGDGNADPTADGVGFFPNNRNRINTNTPQEVGTAYRNIVGRVDYETHGLLFTSITGTISSDFQLAGDIDGSSLDAFNEFRNIERTSFSQEIRIQNTTDSRWQWNIGAIYADDEGEIWNRTRTGADNRFGLPVGFLIDGQNDEAGAESWAVFGEVDYAINDKLNVSAGGRYSEEKISANIQGFSGAFVQNLSAKDKFTDFSPRFTANYAWSDDIGFYATISKGFKSGGAQISPFPSGDSYKPEEMWNYEIGMKGDFIDGRLRLNLALFYMDWSDLQTNFQESGQDANGNFILFAGTDNAESATTEGVELSATALLTENLVANLNIGYLNASFGKFTTFIDGANRVLDSAAIPLSPKWTISADAEYRRPIMDKYEGFARLEYSYRHGTKTLIAGLIQSGFPWEVPSYDFFNLRAGIETDDWTITGYAENLFDETYYTNAYQKAFAGGLFAEPSFRSYGIRVNYRFDKK
jgi:iron complex outermembrane recepter protein